MNHSDKDRNESASHETIVIINCVLNAPLMLISITGNALVLAAILRTPSIRSTSMIMLRSLAVSDLLVGFIAQPLYIADELQSLKTQDFLLYHLSSMAGFVVCGLSLGTMTAISMDRFLAHCYHMRYGTSVTKSRVLYAIITIWLIMQLWLGLYFWNKYVYHLMAGIFTGTLLIICSVYYIKIYRIVCQHQSQMRSQQMAVERANIGNNIHMVLLKKSAMTTFVFYICMVICYFPNFILLTMFGTSHKDWKTEWTFATTVVFTNSAINPFSYCWRLRDLRVAVLKIVKKLFHQVDEN